MWFDPNISTLPHGPRFDGSESLETLEGLFDSSLPRPTKLSAHQLSAARRLAEKGHDAAGIAMLIGASPAAVATFLDRLAAEKRAEAERLANQEQARLEIAQINRRAAEQRATDESARKEVARATPAAPPAVLDIAPHDAQLIQAHVDMICDLHSRGVPVETLAASMRLTRDQVIRVLAKHRGTTQTTDRSCNGR